MFANVMWATDGSDDADRALPLALRIVDEGHARLHVVHVVEKLAPAKFSGPTTRLDEREVYDKVRRQVEQARGDEADRAILHIATGNAGQAAERIADLARVNKVDLIVVGSRGHSALVGVMLGSVTQALLHLAPCPVLAVPPQASIGADDIPNRSSGPADQAPAPSPEAA